MGKNNNVVNQPANRPLTVLIQHVVNSKSKSILRTSIVFLYL